MVRSLFDQEVPEVSTSDSVVFAEEVGPTLLGAFFRRVFRSSCFLLKGIENTVLQETFHQVIQLLGIFLVICLSLAGEIKSSECNLILAKLSQHFNAANENITRWIPITSLQLHCAVKSLEVARIWQDVPGTPNNYL